MATNTNPYFRVSAVLLTLTAQTPPTPADSGRILPGVEAIAKAAPYRPVEARLSGGFAFTACEPSPLEDLIPEPLCATGISASSPEWKALAAVEKQLRSTLRQRNLSAGAYHQQGVWSMVWHHLDGQLDQALDSLTRAAELAGEDARILNDLAAVYHTLAQRRDNPENLVQGLDLIERALEIAPSLPEARFNRGLFLDSLGLVVGAAQAWQHYVETVEDDWSAEALQRLRRLGTPPQDVWPRVLEEIRSATLRGDLDNIASQVDRFRQDARLAAEGDLLKLWATARMQGHEQEAAHELALARVIGTALATVAGDQMLEETVAAIDAALADRLQTERLDDLEHGHSLYGEGLTLLDQRRFLEAAVPLGEAAALLDQAASPFAAWARFLLLRCSYQALDYEGAIEKGRSILEAAQGHSFPNLVGRTAWVTGVSLMILGHPEEAMAAYRTAQAAFEVSREKRHLLAVRTLLADGHRYLGNTSAAWESRFAALSQLRGTKDPRRMQVTLGESAAAAMASAHMHASLAFQAEILHGMGPGELPSVRAAALRERAEIYHRLGRQEAALKDLAEANGFAARIPDTVVRRSVSGNVLMVEGAVLRANAPHKSLAALDAAIEIFRESNYGYRLAELLHERAKTHLALSDLASAESDLSSAIAIREQQRARIGQGPRRVSFLDRGLSVFEDLTLLLAGLGRPEEALVAAERSRSRHLLEQLTPGNGSEVTPLSVDELSAAPPTGTVAVEYAVLPDRLLIWTVAAGSVHFREVKVAALALARMVEGLDGAAADEPEDLLHRRAAVAYDALVRPVETVLPAGAALIFVPDKMLYRVPFSLLKSRERDRFLIEDREILIAPSLSALAAIATSGGDLRSASIVVVANPQHDEQLFEGLKRLPGAEDEASAIRKHYPRSRVLIGEGASRNQLAEALGGQKILHLATHSFANDTAPSLSSLVLARDEDDSGVLYAREIPQLDLESVELVFLAACDSGRGNHSKSEGLSGLVWPFLAAGVPVVIASLWKLDDGSSGEVVERFYRHLRDGQPPAAALRLAKLELLREEGLSRRDVWAALEVFGASR